jgi:hypothetical protein
VHLPDCGARLVRRQFMAALLRSIVGAVFGLQRRGFLGVGLGCCAAVSSALGSGCCAAVSSALGSGCCAAVSSTLGSGSLDSLPGCAPSDLGSLMSASCLLRPE